jgi:hypothetical protein
MQPVLVWRTHDAHQLAMVEPVETTRVTAVDDDAASAEIENERPWGDGILDN